MTELRLSDMTAISDSFQLNGARDFRYNPTYVSDSIEGTNSRTSILIDRPSVD